jgi:hypothetical protein
VKLVFRSNMGKLLVCSGVSVPRRKRYRCVRTATEETARRLNLDFESVKFDQTGSPIYVYYDNDDGDPIPLYCDEGKNGDLKDICSALRKMIFVLSFHPKHSSLKSLRNELMRLS